MTSIHSAADKEANHRHEFFHEEFMEIYKQLDIKEKAKALRLVYLNDMETALRGIEGQEKMDWENAFIFFILGAISSRIILFLLF